MTHEFFPKNTIRPYENNLTEAFRPGEGFLSCITKETLTVRGRAFPAPLRLFQRLRHFYDQDAEYPPPSLSPK
jgi:hypothetical protein